MMYDVLYGELCVWYKVDGTLCMMHGSWWMVNIIWHDMTQCCNNCFLDGQLRDASGGRFEFNMYSDRYANEERYEEVGVVSLYVRTGLIHL